eukprot:CAMPEP_0194267026 /NCGR_PEP_ID=MMETSP0169-20130528/1713_1 /TAXON_ID=218684 /ORGANISM="Corethron pennatum, Strain L29A3" /LENGTH=279 /DNA_ID=CAMNT_0039007823 /DNA_START=230 /DNA_END=1069 /DNA_ORIENTATION=-
MALQGIETVPSNAPTQSLSSEPTTPPSICPYSKQLRAGDLSGTHENFEYYINGDVLTWNEHNACARAWGGNLTSVHSEGERSFLAMLISHDVDGGVIFIGGMRRSGALDFDGGARAWEWSDGTSWGYTNWTAGEPDSRYGGVRRSDRVAAAVGSALWIDRPGNERAAAIYKRIDDIEFARSEGVSRGEKDTDAIGGLQSGSYLWIWAVPAAVIVVFGALAMVVWELSRKSDESSTKLKVSNFPPFGLTKSISNLSESATSLTTLKVSNSTQISNSTREP